MEDFKQAETKQGLGEVIVSSEGKKVLDPLPDSS